MGHTKPHFSAYFYMHEGVPLELTRWGPTFRPCYHPHDEVRAPKIALPIMMTSMASKILILSREMSESKLSVYSMTGVAWSHMKYLHQ